MRIKAAIDLLPGEWVQDAASGHWVRIGSVSVIAGEDVRLGIWWCGAWRHPTLEVNAQVHVSDGPPDLVIRTVGS